MTLNITRRETLSGAAAALLAVPLAGCGGDGDGGDGGGGNTIGMSASAFEPDSLTISVGETVTWENTSAVAHTVTAYDDGIPSGAEYFASGDYENEDAARDAYPPGGEIEAEGTYEHTFETAGEYEYFCIPHEAAGMTGTITVEE